MTDTTSAELAVFPIMAFSHRARDELAEYRSAGETLVIVGIPWDMIAPHEQQARHNHGQSLQTLASRGGLSACEALAVLEGRPWRSIRRPAANRQLAAALGAWTRPQPAGEVKRLQAVIERDRSVVATVFAALKKEIAGSSHLRVGRGNYAWNDDRWMQEFGAAVDRIAKAMEPLRKVAGDLSDSPKTHAEVMEARAGDVADLRAAAEQAKKVLDQVATMGAKVGPIYSHALQASHQLAAALTAREAPGWRPIETAPRDGTCVIVGVAGVPRSVGEAYWWQNEQGRGGWQTWDGENHRRTVYDPGPTHWQLLPAAPQPKEG